MVKICKAGVFLLPGFDTQRGAQAEASEFGSVLDMFGSSIFTDKSATFPDPRNSGVRVAVASACAVPFLAAGGADREWAVLLSVAVEASDVEENRAVEKADTWLRLAAQKAAKVMVQ